MPSAVRRAIAPAAVGVCCIVALASSAVADDAVAPDFSGVWARSTFGWGFPESGPGPLKNLQRRPNGISDAQMLVGDYNSPVLKPNAARIVREHGDASKAGVAFPDPSNQCLSMGTPYILRINEMQMAQKQDMITIMYMQDHQFRRIRMNGAHPKEVKPTWHGDSVGHYEGDTLVIDTVGIKAGPISMVDQYGTPHSDQLHVIERYRLLPEDEAKALSAKNDHEYGRADGPSADGVFVDYGYKGKGLQVEFTVDDPVMFTAPWKGYVTYLRAANGWEERVCAENTFEYYDHLAIPTADRPDF